MYPILIHVCFIDVNGLCSELFGANCVMSSLEQFCSFSVRLLLTLRQIRRNRNAIKKPIETFITGVAAYLRTRALNSRVFNCKTLCAVVEKKNCCRRRWCCGRRVPPPWPRLDRRTRRYRSRPSTSLNSRWPRWWPTRKAVWTRTWRKCWWPRGPCRPSLSAWASWTRPCARWTTSSGKWPTCTTRSTTTTWTCTRRGGCTRKRRPKRAAEYSWATTTGCWTSLTKDETKCSSTWGCWYS